MSDGRFYTIVMCILLTAVVLILLLFNWLQQPEGLDRALWTMILTFVGPTVAVILNNMANSKQAQKLNEGQQRIESKIAAAPDELKSAAVVAKDKIESAAAYAAQTLLNTASSLAQKG